MNNTPLTVWDKTAVEAVVHLAKYRAWEAGVPMDAVNTRRIGWFLEAGYSPEDAAAKEVRLLKISAPLAETLKVQP